MIKIRCLNRNKIKNTLYTHNNYNNQLIIIENNKETFTSWFGLCFMINEKYINKYRDYLRYLNTVGIENRPIISGNFLRQPATKLILNDIYDSNELYKLNPELYEGAEIINNRCFYIGLHPIEISNKECNILVNKLLDFYHIKNK